MIKVSPTSDMALVKEIMAEPRLAALSFTDEDLDSWNRGSWLPGTFGWLYLKLTCNEEVIGIVRCQEVTSTTLDCHWHLKVEYHGTGLSTKADKAVHEFLSKRTHYIKQMGQFPESSKHIAKVANKVGYELEGVLIKGILWRGKLENLYLMGRFIRRDNNG